MEKPTKTRASGGGAAIALVTLFFCLLPILYVLALGPLVWIHHRGWMPDPIENVVEAAYWPLEYASRKTFLKEPLEWYVSLWEDRMPVVVPTVAPTSSPNPTPARAGY